MLVEEHNYAASREDETLIYGWNKVAGVCTRVGESVDADKRGRRGVARLKHFSGSALVHLPGLSSATLILLVSGLFLPTYSPSLSPSTPAPKHVRYLYPRV